MRRAVGEAERGGGELGSISGAVGAVPAAPGGGGRGASVEGVPADGDGFAGAVLGEERSIGSGDRAMMCAPLSARASINVNPSGVKAPFVIVS